MLFVGKKEGGAMEWMWSTALLVLIVVGRPSFHRIFFGHPPVLTFSKCSQTVQSSGLVQEKVLILWWYCLPSSAAFFDHVMTLKHPWQMKGGWASGL